MSIFNELLPKLFDISKGSVININEELQAALKCLDKLADEYQNGRNSAKDKTLEKKDKIKDKLRTTALQSINEDNESPKTLENNADNKITISTENNPHRVSKKRSKDEVDGISSPELDKRQKRNASVKAQTNISKQENTEVLKTLNESEVEFISADIVVNVNLLQKLRREESTEKSRGRRRKDEDKENAEPIPEIQIKQEKLSIPPEPMDLESVPNNAQIVKQEPIVDQEAMPPPAAPEPKSRKAIQKNNSEESSEEESGSGRRRTTRTRKQTDADAMPPPPPPVASSRSTRASSRASSRAKNIELADDAPLPRPKRTKSKKVLETSNSVSDQEATQPPEEIVLESPMDKRPKRTRRGKMAAEKEQQRHEEPDPTPIETISPKEERMTQSEPSSPVLPVKEKSKTNLKKTDEKNSKEKIENEDDKVQNENSNSKPQKESKIPRQNSNDKKKNKTKKETEEPKDVTDNHDVTSAETRKIVNNKLNVTVTINNDNMDKTMVLPNGVYNHAPVTPKDICNNETVIIETCRETMVLEHHRHINDATVVIGKEQAPNLTDDSSSILTEDNSTSSEEKLTTPPKTAPNVQQPTSAVKEKVQQFEELASRTTRTKTRALAKLEEQENQTPPDKVTKPVLSAEILKKMNNMIFNGKTNQVSSSASKPKANLPPLPHKSNLPASTSKLSSLSKHKEAAEESLQREKEDARKKKEAMLEAKRELQKKKREEKMANAMAAREAAELQRQQLLQAAQRGRMEKQAQVDQGKRDRLREVERKKQELARKVAETEERRKAEEAARLQRLAEEQKRAEAARKKQLEEAEAMKKEAAMMAREIEKRQKEYMEKLKHKQENNKIHTPLTPGTSNYCLEPVYMADGFEFLVSDEEIEAARIPIPEWSTSRARKVSLSYQAELTPRMVEQMFSVQIYSPDLREIFPSIERKRLKRTSSAVWRTPPRLPPRAQTRLL